MISWFALMSEEGCFALMIKEGSNLTCKGNLEKQAAEIVLQCLFPHVYVRIHAYSSNPVDVSSEFSSIAMLCAVVCSQSAAAETIYFRIEVVKHVKNRRKML